MNTVSIGQFLPANCADLKKRGKRFADELGVPLMKAHQGLADAYGFSSFNEATNRSHVGPGGPYSDGVLLGEPIDWSLVHARDRAVIRAARRLTGGNRPGPAEQRALALGLFDSPAKHGELTHALKEAISEDLTPVGLPEDRSMSSFVVGDADMSLAGHRLINAIDSALSFEPAFAARRLHALALATPGTPWAAGAALIQADENGAFAYSHELGFGPAASRAWNMRHLAQIALDGYEFLQPRTLAEPDETPPFAQYRDAAMTAAGRVFAAIGLHSDAVSAFSLVRAAEKERTVLRVPTSTLRSIALLNSGTVLNRSGRDISTVFGHRYRFEHSLLRALNGYVGGRAALSLRDADLFFARALAATPHLMSVLHPQWGFASTSDPAGLPEVYVEEIIARLEPFFSTTRPVYGHLVRIVQDPGVQSALARVQMVPMDSHRAALSILEEAVHACSKRLLHVPELGQAGERPKMDISELDRWIEAGRQMYREGKPSRFNQVHNYEEEMEAAGWLLEHLGRPPLERGLSNPVLVDLGRRLFEDLYDSMHQTGLTDLQRATLAEYGTIHILRGDVEFAQQAKDAVREREFGEFSYAEINQGTGV